MHDSGVLGERTVIGHGIFLDHHPWLHWTTRKDLGLFADHAVSIAHCPTVSARRGITLRTFGEYLRDGINLGIGTDTYPHNFVEEMRAAVYYARVIAETVDDLEKRSVREVYVHGEKVVGHGKVLTIDYPAASEILEVAQQRSLTRTRQLDWAGRTADEMSPMVYPTIAGK